MAVYAKTAKGVELMEKQTHSLPRRTWQVFITIDGKRDTAELEKMFPGDTLASALDVLGSEGLIRPVAGAAAASMSAAQTSADGETLLNARNLMVNTTLSFAGHVAGPLIQRLKEAATLAELRGMREEWRKTVAMNPMALMHLRTIDKQLDKLFA
jgi:hypothetical protein